MKTNEDSSSVTDVVAEIRFDTLVFNLCFTGSLTFLTLKNFLFDSFFFASSYLEILDLTTDKSLLIYEYITENLPYFMISLYFLRSIENPVIL